MKKEYITKKKLTFATLSVMAVCLTGGLVYYIGSVNNEDPTASNESHARVEDNVDVANTDKVPGVVIQPLDEEIKGEIIETNPLNPYKVIENYIPNVIEPKVVGNGILNVVEP